MEKQAPSFSGQPDFYISLIYLYPEVYSLSAGFSLFRALARRRFQVRKKFS
jgi:hypothetical protein